MNILQATIEFPRVRFELKLPMIPLPPHFGNFYHVEEKINGIGDDGITDFVKTLERAISLLPDKVAARNILFTTDRNRHQHTSDTYERIKKLSTFSLADPGIIWSMYKEEGQPTFRFLQENLGVTTIQALRRTLVHHGNVVRTRNYSLISYQDPDTGLWDLDFCQFRKVTHDDIPVLLNKEATK